MKLLVVDNFDSFTYMLVDYLRQAGATCHVVRNNESLARLTNLSVNGVVLSPGPGTPRQAGRLMDVIAHYAGRVPLLGVCLGHQAIGEFYGATLAPAALPMHGKVSTIRVQTDDVLFQGLPGQFSVTRYHSLVLRDLPDTLISTALTDQNEVMAIRHAALPIWGVQFHPEAALTQFGLPMVLNWINFLKFSTIEQEDSASFELLC
ncbi:aminodeoxychorismate/anthranilate synthase component II [Spirosoma taeanense]|uniref:Aminodeoxychorismate/anthranilate synthase component II n=1 Tax=Spirosoma taeanense TaxID=2735870 RepID=A0A6M5Y6T3_9BACT|nr:aminodeoxychorismate/anthranilate synthase component II [Spirosoma taeanense]QJW89194.1 aminodeoxychorismate/anthranilate synthase component II [Spirosoma taeanense]